jgi:hypothetical protein
LGRSESDWIAQIGAIAWWKKFEYVGEFLHSGALVGEMAEWFKAHAWKA